MPAIRNYKLIDEDFVINQRVAKRLRKQHETGAEAATTAPATENVNDLIKRCEDIETQCELVLKSLDLYSIEPEATAEGVQELYRKVREGLFEIKSISWNQLPRDDGFTLQKYADSLAQYSSIFEQRYENIFNKIQYSKAVEDFPDLDQIKTQRQLDDATRKLKPLFEQEKKFLRERQQSLDEMDALDEVTTDPRSTAREIREAGKLSAQLARRITAIDGILAKTTSELAKLQARIPKLQGLADEAATKASVKQQKNYQEKKKLQRATGSEELISSLNSFIQKLNDGLLIHSSGATGKLGGSRGGRISHAMTEELPRRYM
jgi:hypothetical protein